MPTRGFVPPAVCLGFILATTATTAAGGGNPGTLRDLVPKPDTRLAEKQRRPDAKSSRTRRVADAATVADDTRQRVTIPALTAPELMELKSDDGSADGVGIVGDGLMVVNRLTPPRYSAIVKVSALLLR